MATTIKAIETRYAGYRFRSRLEARWAVFFDSAGVSWLYEPEGFHLQSGMYLPDFFLPSCKLWVEVKPLQPTEEEIKHVVDLACGSQQRAIILVGVPGLTTHEVVEPANLWTYDSTEPMRLARCRRECGGFGYSNDDGVATIFGCSCKSDKWPIPFDERHFKAARSARFEFGEEG